MGLSLAEVLEKHWVGYQELNRSSLSSAHYRAVRAVLSCRTPRLGGRLFECGGCTKKHFAYHSCNHRSCPQCGALDQQIWCAKQEARLLPVPYFMLTFTIPSELRAACLGKPAELYKTLLCESASALKEVIASKFKGAEIGFTSVLHTWGRQIQHHPHVHVIVPAVAFHRASSSLVKPKKEGFLIHFRPLAERFRNRMKLALAKLSDLHLSDEAKASLQANITWNVQVKHVGRGATALRYLARYVQRSAFNPKRLLGYDSKGNIRISWICSNTNKRSVMHLPPHEFIRRWLLHVLPKGFARVRHFGYLSAAARKTRIHVRGLLGIIGEPSVQVPEQKPFCCGDCGGQLIYLRDLEKMQSIWCSRPPPLTTLRIEPLSR